MTEPAAVFHLACLELCRQRTLCELREVIVREALRAWAETEDQKVIARLLGVSPQFLNDILHSRRSISAAFLNAVEEKLL